MRLFIKNMVCLRCIKSVEEIVSNNQMEARFVVLGEVELEKSPGDKQLKKFSDDLREIGFELLDENKHKIIQKIKTVIIESVHYDKSDSRYNLSQQLSKKLNKDYSYLSHLFSAVEGTTIEKYLISQKVERIKELLVYDEYSLGEIAYQLGYSSPAHLSSQFKKATGLTPSYFKKMGGIHRKKLDQV